VVITEDRPTVHLDLDSTPETLTLVRGALGALAELIALDSELVDDVKTAVSEACNNVVLHAYDGAPGRLSVRLYVHPEGIEVVVRDDGRGMSASSAEDPEGGLGMAVIRALTEHAEFRASPGGGTEVRMLFAGRRDGQALFSAPEGAAPEDRWTQRLSGDAVASVSPVSFVGELLGRLARALAARARFSIDRFADIYLVTDAIAARSIRAAHGSRIAFAVRAQSTRLELTVGPFQPGSIIELRDQASEHGVGSALALLTDELEVHREDDAELLHVVMIDSAR